MPQNPRQSVASLDSGYSTMSSNTSLAGPPNQAPFNMTTLNKEQMLKLMMAQNQQFLNVAQLSQNLSFSPSLLVRPVQAPYAFTPQQIHQVLFNL